MLARSRASSLRAAELYLLSQRIRRQAVDSVHPYQGTNGIAYPFVRFQPWLHGPIGSRYQTWKRRVSPADQPPSAARPGPKKAVPEAFAVLRSRRTMPPATHMRPSPNQLPPLASLLPTKSNANWLGRKSVAMKRRS